MTTLLLGAALRAWWNDNALRLEPRWRSTFAEAVAPPPGSVEATEPVA